MAQRPKDDEVMPGAPGRRFSRFLTIDQVAEILNVNKPTIYALLRSGEMKGLRLGGRGVWRISEDDLQTFLDAAYQETADAWPQAISERRRQLRARHPHEERRRAGPPAGLYLLTAHNTVAPTFVEATRTS